MRPTLTTGGKSILATAGLFILGGVVVRSWPLVSLGGLALCGLLVAMVLFYPRAILLRRRQLELAWWIPPSETASGALMVGSRFRLQLLIRNRSPYHLGRAEIKVAHGRPLEMLTDFPTTLIPSGTEVELRLPAHCQAAGHWFFYGVNLRLVGPLGLYQVDAYYPLPLAARIFPRFGAGRVQAPHRPRTGTPHERTGRHPLKLRGLGGDLREIRDHQHGDPFKHIAWKATARTRRLMVKEYESEIMVTHYVVLDISGSMRSGPLGQTKLDYGIELAASFARYAIEAGDRVGLITFDSRVYSMLRPADGRPHLSRIVDRLMDLHNVVDEDLTNLTQPELVKAVSDFVLYQDGVDVRLTTAPPPESDLWQNIASDTSGTLYDLKALQHWIQTTLKRLKARRTAHHFWGRVVASHPFLAELRLYCRLRGIELPYRSGDELHGIKDRGFIDAVGHASASRGSQFILVLSDLEGLTAGGALIQSLAMAKKRHHHVALLTPHTPRFGPQPQTDSARLVADVLDRDHHRSTHRIRREIEKLGIPVLHAAPEDALMLVLGRLARLRQLRAGRGR